MYNCLVKSNSNVGDCTPPHVSSPTRITVKSPSSLYVAVPNAEPSGVTEPVQVPISCAEYLVTTCNPSSDPGLHATNANAASNINAKVKIFFIFFSFYFFNL